IAWGFTIVGTDQADIVVEELDPKGADLYKVGDRWERIQGEYQRPAVKTTGLEPLVPVELRYTRNGPVLAEDRKTNRAFVLRWAAHQPGGAAYLASLAVARAGNRREFLDAMGRWKIPALNFVYADVDGHIGWIAAGATPVRKGHDGLLPVPGRDEFGW